MLGNSLSIPFTTVRLHITYLVFYFLPSIPYTAVRLHIIHLVFALDFHSLTQPYDCTWCISFLLLSFNPLHSRTIAHVPSRFWSSSFATPISFHTYQLSVPLKRFTLYNCKRPTHRVQRFGRLSRTTSSILHPQSKNIPTKTPAEGQIRCNPLLGAIFI